MEFVPNAVFCHDLAFYLDVKSKKKWSGTGFFFRNDKEGLADRIIPLRNRDLSLEGNEKSDINLFLNVVDEFEIIKTDRLHVAIWWILLDKKVELYSNNYFKNKSIYRSSLENLGVLFFDTPYLW
jgi:exopolysaccharide biosynthesis predicted pyruvyltransferase EpsI